LWRSRQGPSILEVGRTTHGGCCMPIKPETTALPPRQETSIDSSPEEASETLGYLLQSQNLQSLAESPELKAVIKGAMEGSLPLSEPLEVNQPEKLSPRAIQTVLLSIGGYYTLREIAEISGMNYVYVTKLVKHPYAKRIRAIAGANAVAQFSAMERRIKRKAPKMLKIVEEIAIDDSVDSPTRLRAAFGWLDRAGHNTIHKSETKTEVSGGINITAGRSKLLAAAISEAKGLSEAEEADFEVLEEAKSA